MAVPSCLCYRKSDHGTGESHSEDFSEKSWRRAGRRLCDRSSYLSVQWWSAISGPLLSLSFSAGGRFCAGGILVLSAACHQFSERRKYESLCRIGGRK